MNDETAPAEESEPDPTPIQILAVPRLGNVQLLLTLEGQGLERAVYAKISRIGVQEDRTNVWSMEDLGALATLTAHATKYAMEVQTMHVRPGEQEGA